MHVRAAAEAAWSVILAIFLTDLDLPSFYLLFMNARILLHGVCLCSNVCYKFELPRSASRLADVKQEILKSFLRTVRVFSHCF